MGGTANPVNHQVGVDAGDGDEDGELIAGAGVGDETGAEGIEFDAGVIDSQIGVLMVSREKLFALSACTSAAGFFSGFTGSGLEDCGKAGAGVGAGLGESVGG